MLFTLVLLFFISAVCVTSQEITVRRDADWPPPIFVEKMQAASKHCKTETGIDVGLISRFSDQDVHDHPDLKCYMKCIFIYTNAMDENGKLNVKVPLEMIAKTEPWAQEIFFNMGNKCFRVKYPKDMDLCEKVYQINKCFKEADPVHYFLL